MANQFGRSATLVVQSASNALDLSELHIKFQVRQSDLETPNNAVIRVYNLSDQTTNLIRNEYTKVTLQAGYINGNLGVIFSGDIKQFMDGHENNVTRYLDIHAADGDIGYNFGVVNTSVAKGSSPAQILSVAASAMGLPVDPNAPAALTGGFLPRGKVLFGMARDFIRGLATTSSAKWSIINGVIQIIPLTGYRNTEVVAINSQTGMVGFPETTDNGIKAKALLNPLLQVGGRVKINNADINTAVVVGLGATYNSPPPMIASVSSDGIYKMLVVEHVGDTRGNEWHSETVCVAVDSSNNTVKAYG